jgi:hypothetical protein
MWGAIARYSAAEKWFKSIIWRACTQKPGVCSIGTRIQAANRILFTTIFKLTPFEGSASGLRWGRLDTSQTPRQGSAASPPRHYQFTVLYPPD